MKRSSKSTSAFLNTEKELNYVPYWAKNRSHYKLLLNNTLLTPTPSHSKLSTH